MKLAAEVPMSYVRESDGSLIASGTWPRAAYVFIRRQARRNDMSLSELLNLTFSRQAAAPTCEGGAK